jgi:uncharacterized RDD family membrane protein YckC
MQNIRIQTTQNVVIEYQPASVGDRIIATLLDNIILGAYSYSVIIIVFKLNWNFSTAGWIFLFIPVTFYHLLCEIFMDGQTLCKRLMKIKVVKLDGTQPTVGSYLLRWLLRTIDITFSFGAIAVVTIAAGGKGQRLGDMAAGTTVVSLRRRVGLEDTRLPVLEEDYSPVYPQAALLSDRDIGIIKEALHIYANSSSPDPFLIEVLTKKVKELLGVEVPVSPLTFLRTVLRDHTYLTSRV